jgi:hypothetical protein
MLSQQALLIIFFAKPCRRQPTLPKRCASTIYLYAVRFALQQAMQQQGGFANLLFFLID